MKLNDTAQSNIYQFQSMRVEETRKIKTVDKAHVLRGEEVLVLGKTQMSCSGSCSVFWKDLSQLDFSVRSHFLLGALAPCTVYQMQLEAIDLVLAMDT